MLADLRALLALAIRGERPFAVGLALCIVGSIVADFTIMLAVLAALAHRRAGELYGQQVVIFLLAVALFYVLNVRANRELNRRYAEAARAMVVGITGRLPRLPLLEYEALGRGTLVTRLLGDGGQIAGCRRVVYGVISGAIRLLLGAVLAVQISPTASAVALGAIIMIGFIVAAQLGGLQRGFGELAPDDARMYDLLRSQALGGPSLKVHRPRARALASAFESISRRVEALRVALFTTFYERQFAADFLFYALLGVTTFALPLVASVTAEEVRELNLVSLWLVLGVVKLISGAPKLTSAGAALARLRDLEERLGDARIEPAVRDGELDGGPFAGFRRVRVEQLEFHYPATDGGGFTLGPLDVEFERGELVFITGRNGSGKSTFARLLAGLYRPSAGRIVVDGVPLADETRNAWRMLISTVFVEHCIFERTHGLDAGAEARAPELLARFQLAHKTSIADGRVSNRALSTGQRKRLAMVLAQLSDKPVLLLDEWAAEQDPEFRETFYDSLLPQLRDEGRLVIVITHDETYFSRADRCLRLEGDRFVEVSP